MFAEPRLMQIYNTGLSRVRTERPSGAEPSRPALTFSRSGVNVSGHINPGEPFQLTLTRDRLASLLGVQVEQLPGGISVKAGIKYDGKAPEVHELTAQSAAGSDPSFAALLNPPKDAANASVWLEVKVKGRDGTVYDSDYSRNFNFSLSGAKPPHRPALTSDGFGGPAWEPKSPAKLAPDGLPGAVHLAQSLPLGTQDLSPAARFAPISPSATVKESSASLCAYLGPLLKEQVTSFNYDSLIFVNRFLEHLEAQREKTPSLSPLEAMKTFEPSAYAEVEGNGGSHCVGLATHLVDYLREQGLPAFVVGAREEGSASKLEVFHAAAMVKFENPDDPKDKGYVLLEPGLNFTTPVVIKPDQPGRLDQGGQTYNYTLDDKNLWMDRVFRDGFVKKASFPLQEWQNPEILTRLAPMLYDRPALLARNEQGGVVEAVIPDLRQRTFELRVRDQRVIVPFDDPSRLEATVTPEFAEVLNFSREELLGRLEQISRHADELKQLLDERR
jgi:hypothetical protein